MKRVIMMVVLMSVGASVFAGDLSQSVRVISTKLDVVYMKVCSAMIGASIEVYDSNGVLIISDKVVDNKLIVDFFAEPAGAYTIRVTKDDVVENINFEKTSDSHVKGASTSYVTISQM